MLTRPYALARPACPGVYLRAAQGSSSTLVVNTGSAGSGTGAVAATSTAVTGPTTAAGPPYGVGAAAGTTVATDRRLRSGQLEFVVRTPFPSRAPAPAAAILDAVAASQNDLFPELRTVRAWLHARVRAHACLPAHMALCGVSQTNGPFLAAAQGRAGATDATRRAAAHGQRPRRR